MRRGDSFPVCPKKAEHRLNNLQRWVQAAAISLDPRDGRETLTLLLQPPRILCASTGHYPYPPPGNLCSMPLPGSCDPGTTSPGEHKVRLRLLQSHSSLCCRRFTLHPYPSLPLTWVSQSPLISRCFKPVLRGQGTDAWGWPTNRGGAKTKAEPQELCKQRREREISPCSLSSSRLNPHSNLMYPSSVEYLNRQWIIPKLRQWTLGANVHLQFAVYDRFVSDIYVYLSLVFSACYHWWICLLVWLLSLFLIIIFYVNNFS